MLLLECLAAIVMLQVDQLAVRSEFARARQAQKQKKRMMIMIVIMLKKKIPPPTASPRNMSTCSCGLMDKAPPP